MQYYIMTIAPMDSGFTGPFESFDTARDWAIDKVSHDHDWRVVTESEMRTNVAEYGEPGYVQLPY
jgi:hypothetical protein